MEQLKSIFSSYVTMIILLALFASGLAAATFIEKVYGTALAKVAIYYSPLFFFIQVLLVVNYVTVVITHGLWRLKKWGFLIFHFSFIVILSGALISHFFSKEGILHLREGEISDRMRIHTNRGESVHILPFQVELVKFTLKHYPGSTSPSSYESELLVHVDGTTQKALVYMNNTLDMKGYRFFQASFDSDERGTVLSVNKDAAGRNVTYAGYLLLFVGGILCLTGKNGRIGTLFKLLRKSKAAVIALLLGVAVWGQAQTKMPPSAAAAALNCEIDAAHAERFGALPVRSVSGRVIPVNTFSSEILRKLYKKTRIGKLDSDRFLLSVFAMPEMWSYVPFIAYSNDEMTTTFGLTEKYCAYAEVFDEDGSYKLQEMLDAAYQKMPAKRNAFDKEIIKLDEKINIFHQLINYQLINIFPDATDSMQRWYAPGDDLSVFSGQDSLFVSRIFFSYVSEIRDALTSGKWAKADDLLEMISTYQHKRSRDAELGGRKIALELKYNKLAPFQWCRAGYLSLGGLMLVFSFILLFRDKREIRTVVRILGVIVLPVFLLHMFGMGMRWQIGGYAPWSNSYETMVYVAWAVVFAGMLFSKRSPVTFALATLFAGVILFVSSLNWMDPQINPLPPVLKSPWLMFHVAVLMAAYGFFGIGFLIGLTDLVMMSVIRKKEVERHARSLKELSVINELSLWIGLILMATGTFMGAVWANESWGRYWGWDPKETWALITIVVYVMVTHLHLLKKQYNLWLFNLCSVVAFSSVLMTYFGVNYFLSGLHSYGENEHIKGIFVYLYAAAIAAALLALFARKGKVLK
ncbi:MAG: cytochrome c biogenesis protein CcsA [Tannerella sp.]|jgi:cytochrome c-type biogenesis protein CcsB|nr:cytochrome c biogenesis protein CcsA [Tannerella sp.]